MSWFSANFSASGSIWNLFSGTSDAACHGNGDTSPVAWAKPSVVPLGSERHMDIIILVSALAVNSAAPELSLGASVPFIFASLLLCEGSKLLNVRFC